jgi:hypothetical protein
VEEVMAKTLAEYRELTKRLLSELDDPGAPSRVYSDTWIDAYLNLAQTDVAYKVRDQFRARAVAALAVGPVAVPTNYLCDLSIWYSGVLSGNVPVLLTQTTERELDAKTPGWTLVSSSITPTNFLVSIDSTGATKYRIYPYPAAPDGEGVTSLNLIYTAAPTEMAAGTSTSSVMASFPEYEAICLPFYAAAQLCYFDGGEKDERAAQLMAMYEATVNKMRAKAQRLAHSRPSYLG